ncbi:hypothetical protein DM01DRAFT_1349866 [Hesseltinella vesiculosa]|uniref:RlpA-like protein double-psi beta-barrel domain-containing protein n=1 Tax=Hesseltinella vesiculosa TaxID=101127 RepID=A0A1X2G3Q8_9FUNG|nr:hypothetical protein DM01DRAFT_1349866 [Hesseltinella vesiculosa]
MASLAHGNRAPVELNDMYLHHHPTQARKLAMAARAAQTQDDYGPTKSYRGRDGSTYGYWNPEDNHPPRGFRSEMDDYEVYGRNLADQGYDNYVQDSPYFRTGNRATRRMNHRPAYFDIGYSDAATRRRMAIPAGSELDPVQYNRNGGIDWTNPMLKGTVFVDRGYHDEDFDITRNIRMTSTVDPGDGFLTGQGTYYDVETRSNVCGTKVSNKDLVAALNTKQFGAKTSDNPNCGKTVQVTGPTGNTVDVTIVDVCDTCEDGGVDLSPAAFEKIGQFSHGSISIKWKHT